ncbi:Hsp20/alpha crystallin family protein [Quadrisphaera sp. INWT6]|uniref:Hsp20/alpha crystallin family protein n=1 Tax=Quadrisphaera sp. INWT6 TaxID=2596917 RepID=UPI00189263ED|nr:Hsp20/alpha crystallin family protein [Quadrisphaera sp. INWT6]MBF5081799.1 Hsp20/alpha crystallin family protein [Quadrisphaera sp. INWT6]
MQFDPFGDPFRQLDRMAQQLVSGARTPLRMPMDVWKDEAGYHVELDLPGVDPSSVDVTTERSAITVRAERSTRAAGSREVLVAERPHGSFVRQLQIGDGLDASGVSADYRDGVLHLLVPVAPSAQPRRVQVSRSDRGDHHEAATGAEQGREAVSAS